MDFGNLFFSSKGRLNRKGYWLSSIALLFFMLIFSLIMGVIVGAMGYANSSLANNVMSFVVFAVMILPVYNIMLKRLHDRARPEILALVFIAPSVIQTILQVTEISGTMQETIILGQQTFAFVPNSIGVIVGAISVMFGLWALVELGFLRGQSGPNAHGPDPLAN